MKTIALMALLVMISGCAVKTMSNDQIIVEAMKCESANLEWRQTFDYKGEVRAVFCVNPSMVRSKNERNP